MPGRVKFNEDCDPYEVELEEMARTEHKKSDDRWMWITGSIVICVIVISLAVSIISLASHKKRRSFLFG